MGRGDRKSKRGKIWRGTHGKRHPKKKDTVEVEEVKVIKPKKKKSESAKEAKTEKPKVKRVKK